MIVIAVQEIESTEVSEPSVANQLFNHSSERMSELPDNSIALQYMVETLEQVVKSVS